MAKVVAIDPCPPLADGSGSVVIGRYVTRQVDQLVKLTVADDTVIEGTPIHPVWSVDREEWVPLGKLHVGERLLGADGPVAITGKQLLATAVPVYNLEIHGEHVYQISGLGILVHNADPCNTVSKLTNADGTVIDLNAPKSVPTVTFSSTTHPELAANIRNAQAAGHPSTLTHGGNAAANRAASLEGIPNVRGLSRDEYPFASSIEGGAGAWVGHIPASQQNSQGGFLANFFRRNNIKPGDKYRVNVD